LKSVLIIQHMAHDHAGRFAELFAEDGLMPHTVRVFAGEAIPSLARYDMMLVLGGAQNTWQEAEFPYLRDEKEAIGEWVLRRAKPYFGICLGHQLLADALGGAVGPAAQGEVGVFDVEVGADAGLFEGLRPRLAVMQWHHAEVQRVPETARVLAQSPRTKVQALGVGEHAFSTQFHCEFTPENVLGWAALPSYIASLEAANGPNAHAELIKACWPHMPRMAQDTRGLWRNFKRLTGLLPAA
jgi:GMP synthase-like glutamine amidotransferase